VSQQPAKSLVTTRRPAAWPEVGRRVRALRTQQKLEIETIAERLGCSTDELAAFEDGEPTLGAYEFGQLSEILNASLGELVYGDEAPLFRGTEDASVAADAASQGRTLMLGFLATRAIST
jgi:transcriptional regulator with XRE-family HTH domain